MSQSIPTAKPSRLSRFVGLAGGLTRAMALAQAEQQITDYRGQALHAIDRALSAMEAVAREASAAPALARRRLFELAYDVAGSAGLVGLDGLGRAARSLCDLVDRLDAERAWSPVGVAVHLQAARLLRDPQSTPVTAATEILISLPLLVARAPILADPAA